MELTDEEKQLLVQMIEKTQWGGTLEEMRAMVARLDGIVGKLSADEQADKRMAKTATKEGEVAQVTTNVDDR